MIEVVTIGWRYGRRKGEFVVGEGDVLNFQLIVDQIYIACGWQLQLLRTCFRFASFDGRRLMFIEVNRTVVLTLIFMLLDFSEVIKDLDLCPPVWRGVVDNSLEQKEW